MLARNSIRRLLIISLIILSITPLFLLSSILSWQSYVVQKIQVEDIQKKQSFLALEKITSYIKEQEAVLVSATRNFNFIGMDRKEQKLMLAKLLSSSGDSQYRDIYNSIALLDSKGKELAIVSRALFLTDADLGERSGAEEYLIPFKTGRIYYSPVYFNNQTGEPYLKISVPITDLRTMRVKGMLVAEIRMNYMWNVIADIQVGESGVAYMLDQKGRVIAHQNPSVVLRGTYFKAPPQQGITTGLQGSKVVLDAEKIKLGGQLFYIVTELPVQEALRYTVRSLIATVVLLILTLSCAIILGYVLIRKIIKPIESLAGTARAIGQGDFSQKADYSGEDEFGILAATFNTMTTQLGETIESLKQSVDERNAAYIKLTERTDELQKANEFLFKERNLIEAMMSSLPGVFYLFTDKGRLLRWNKNTEKILDYSSEEIAARNALDFFVEKDKAHVAEKIEEVFMKGASFVEAHLQTKYGREIPYLLTGLRYEMDDVPCLIGLGLDISGLKQAEEKIKKQNEILNNVLNSLTHPFYVIDADNYTVTLANSAAGFGALTGEATCYALTHRNDKPCEDEKHPCVIKKIKETGMPVTVEHIHHDKEGRIIINEIHGYPIFDRKGNIVQVIEYNLDITDRKKTEEELSRHRQHLQELVTERTAELTMTNEWLQQEIIEHKQAEEKKAELLKEVESVNQELKDFAYIVSHDLKAPLRAISTLANWISTDYKDKLDEEGQQQLDLMVKRAIRMNALINGILEYSRVGRIKEKRIEVDINDLVKEVIEMIVPPENITVTVENELPTIVCEKTRIMEVFQNLLSNAVKFMDKPRGIIKIGSIVDDGYWKFSISDNGPGIEEEYFDKIFQMFQTLSSADEHESTGVGLTLVKKIVTMYGGNIWVESEVGHGSTFFFTLPHDTDNASGPDKENGEN
jgi:PAS domain S-box-containing protein